MCARSLDGLCHNILLLPIDSFESYCRWPRILLHLFVRTDIQSIGARVRAHRIDSRDWKRPLFCRRQQRIQKINCDGDRSCDFPRFLGWILWRCLRRRRGEFRYYNSVVATGVTKVDRWVARFRVAIKLCMRARLARLDSARLNESHAHWPRIAFRSSTLFRCLFGCATLLRSRTVSRRKREMKHENAIEGMKNGVAREWGRRHERENCKFENKKKARETHISLWSRGDRTDDGNQTWN